ncbi:hypothetical protein [Flavobacterium urocaniciphilum]|uniref:Uncharacterized protein n=1 Tax=Flavobacterium urocaniciphilum TaxID=1299341 RepID=A0A1H9E0H5_9FLAO|nr:hypothetical protein [Flavobacterium urocaniciphilum]SEQ19184.1 hypothetical protein SAMN05444005_10921 [Flavobacterium urocaniciphilum]
MKKILSTLFCVLAINVFYAQDIPNKTIKSEVFKDEYKHSTIALVEDDGNGGVFIVRSYFGGIFSPGAGYYFEHYDANLKLIKEFEYEMKRSEFEKYGSILGVIMNGDQVNLIDFVYNTKDKAFVCSALTSKISDFKFDKKELFRLASEDVMKSQWFGGNQFDGDSGTNFILNEDKTAFAITIDIKDKNTETHKVYLFDNKLNKKIDHNFKREIKDKKFKYENIDVSKDGNNLYLLGKVYTDEKKKKKEGGKYQYELTRINKDGQVSQVFDTDEHFSGSLKTVVFQDKLTCIGFYSDRKDYRYKGISYFELDPISLAIRKSKYNPFTEQFIVDKYGKSKDKELKNLSFRGIMITAQNEIVFNAEEFYITTHYHSSPNGGGTTTYVYHYDDIVSAKIGNDGNIIWARNINKRQATSGDESYISYTSTIKGNDTYFFINTGEKVKKLSNDRIQFGQTSTKKSNLNIIRINPEGNFDFQEILDDKANEVPFMVSSGAIASNSVYFIGRKGKKKQILKVTL